MQQWDVIIIGAGAAGLICAANAGYRGRSVLVLDHAKQAGKKILISGGGRCNFTNTQVEPGNYLCGNAHFVKSALARYPSSQFIELIERHGIEYHQRDHGQLFCNDSAKEIVQMLLTECEWAGVTLQLRTDIVNVSALEGQGYVLETVKQRYQCQSLVIATGGLSMPKLGATPLGLQIAEQFGLPVLPTRAGLVPFTLQPEQKVHFEKLSGISLAVTVTAACGIQFNEQLLFTHRGVSGPAILQISSYWQAGETVIVNWLPELEICEHLNSLTRQQPNLSLKNALSKRLPKRLVELFIELGELPDKPLKQLTHAELHQIASVLHHWPLKPGGTEGYRTAEVTLGGVDTNAVSSKTMEAKQVAGLYFIGEVLDVTGWLGGFNFQWAWSSGWAAGQVV